ncbi:GNAT family N-acetyltransferase [Peptoniphilus stercorisuis]|nr:GNAT family N-acetyltransferase [Peptoniphilus stercorisuis]
MLKSKNFSYRKMKLEDVYDFKKWGRHNTPLLDDYNFYEDTDIELKDWFNWKTQNPNNMYFSIFKEDFAIGYISFKYFNKLIKSATLGIVLDPSEINKGYGSEILLYMMDYYFNSLDQKKISLKVATFNKRAISLYSKVGFKKVSTHLNFYENGYFDDTIVDYRENSDSFINFMGKTLFYVDKMVLDRNKFNGVIKCISNFKI